MKLTWPAYIILAIIAVASFKVASSLPTEHILKEIANLPGLVALVGVLYALISDHAAYEKQIALQRDQQGFVLGVTSHMASVVFDKHVEFCERYITCMQKGRSDMFVSGPTEDAIGVASKLSDIRLGYRAWLPADIQEKVLPFEEGLMKIGGSSIILKDLPVGDDRTRVVKEIYDKFDEILDLRTRGNATGGQIAAGKIMDHLQDVLGIKQLFRLMIALVDEAIRTLEKRICTLCSQSEQVLVGS